MTSVGHDIVVMSTYHSLIRHRDIMTGVACGAGNAYPSGAPDFTSGFHRGSCCPVVCVSLFHVIVLSFEFWVFLLFDCLVSIFFTVIHVKNMNLHTHKKRKTPIFTNIENQTHFFVIFNFLDRYSLVCDTENGTTFSFILRIYSTHWMNKNKCMNYTKILCTLT